MKVKFGLKNVHVFPMTEQTDSETGAITMSYGSALAIPGAVNLSLDVSEDTPDPFYADDGVYYVPAGASSGYSGNLEVALMPDEVKLALMTFIKDAAEVMIELKEATAKLFGMTFEIASDAKARKLVYYKCQFGRINLAASTNTSSKTPATDTAPLTVLPTSQLFDLGDGNAISVVSGYSTPDTDSTVYNNWHSAIHTPTAFLDSLTVAPDSQSDEVYEHLVSEIQSADVALSGNTFTGTLYYLPNGMAASGPLSGAGHFMAVKLSNLDQRTTSCLIGLDPSQGTGLVEIFGDPDMVGVFKIANTSQRLKVIQTGAGKERIQIFSLSGLTLEPAPPAEG